jgi:hypothetical protein
MNQSISRRLCHGSGSQSAACHGSGGRSAVVPWLMQSVGGCAMAHAVSQRPVMAQAVGRQLCHGSGTQSAVCHGSGSQSAVVP